MLSLETSMWHATQSPPKWMSWAHVFKTARTPLLSEKWGKSTQDSAQTLASISAQVLPRAFPGYLRHLKRSVGWYLRQNESLTKRAEPGKGQELPSTHSSPSTVPSPTVMPVTMPAFHCRRAEEWGATRLWRNEVISPGLKRVNRQQIFTTQTTDRI